MPCEAWKWLAIITGSLAFLGNFVYLWIVGGYRPFTEGTRQPWVRWLAIGWLTSGVLSIIALAVYLAHCTD